MTAYEIFANISAHQISGIMLHKNMMKAYEFLGIDFMAMWHKHQLMEEMQCSNDIDLFVIQNLNRVLTDRHSPAPFTVPSNWGNVSRLEISNTNRKQYFKEMFDKWHEWEKRTKALYDKSYLQLIEIGDINAAEKVKHLSCAVANELKEVERKYIIFSFNDWDIKSMSAVAKDIKKCYAKEKEVS